MNAHTTTDQVAHGEVSWEDYAGNAVADAFAKAAAAIAELPPVVLQEVEKLESMAFMICMRIATMGAILDQSKSEIAEWETVPLAGEEAVAETVLERAKGMTHSLVRLPRGRCRCTRCGVTLAMAQETLQRC